MKKTDLLSKTSQALAAFLLCLTLAVSSGAFAAEAKADSAKKAVQEQQIPEKVNINKANAEELAQVLTGVGLKKAEAIVSWRKANGKFENLEQLAEVKGIGLATVNKNRKKLVL